MVSKRTKKWHYTKHTQRCDIMTTFSPYQQATLSGSIAILIWSLSASLMSLLGVVPPFLMLTIMLGMGAMVVLTYLTASHRLHTLRQPLKIWAMGAICIIGNYIAYVFAFKYAPPAQVDLISYSWPVLLVLMLPLISQQWPTPRQLLAASIGLIAILLIAQPTTALSLNIAWPGLLCALLAASFWSGYVLVARSTIDTPVGLMGGFCLIGAVLSAILHTLFEPSYGLSATEWGLLYLASIAVGPAFCLWDYGIKQGAYLRLSMASYAIPILSITWLILLDFTTFTPTLIAAGLCVVLATWIIYPTHELQ